MVSGMRISTPQNYGTMCLPHTANAEILITPGKYMKILNVTMWRIGFAYI